MQKRILVALLLVTSSILLPMQSVSAAGNTKMGFSLASQDVTYGDTFTATVWLDGDESIDSFKINLLEWVNGTINANSVSCGWWNWLWDPGDIHNSAGNISGIQAGAQSGTTANQTACTISFSAAQIGISNLNLSDVLAASGGPTVPCATYNTSVTVHPARGTLSAVAYSPYQINLTFTHDSNCVMVIRGDQSSYPSTPQDGIEIFNGTDTHYEHTALHGDDTWYYRAWTFNETHALFSVNYRYAAVTTPITIMGVTSEDVTIGDDFNVSLWLDCAENIDGFKINVSEWTVGMANMTGVDSGWWGWLWDPGVINNTSGNVTGIQAGSQTTTDGNHTACVYNMTADTVGICYINLTDIGVSAGGPYGDCTTHNGTVSIHPANCSLTATGYNITQINLTFSRGTGADQIVIRGTTTGYPSSPSSGTDVYSGNGTSYSHGSLGAGETWYYSAWSYNSTKGLYSIYSFNATNRTVTPNPPVIGSPAPSNGSIWQDLDVTWLVYISDGDGDLMDYTIECSNGDNTSGNNVANGTKVLSIVALNYSTEYTVWVNVTDGINTTRAWFTFKTVSNLSSPSGLDIIKLLIPNDATVENNDVAFLVKLNDPSTYQPDAGKASDIYLYISYLNGSVIVDGDHPTDFGLGMYKYTTSLDETGDYVAWVIVHYGADQYMDAILFKLKWNVYNNVSRLYERLGDIIAVGSTERQNNTRMVIYRVNQLELKLDDIDTSVEEQSILDNMAEIALQSIFETIVMILVLIVFIVIGMAFFGARRTKRLIRSTQPAVAAEKIVFGSEPIFTQDRNRLPPDSRIPPRNRRRF